jgi:tyrosyl-tRNA synthetase
MFKKLMSISDSLMFRYYEVLAETPVDGIDRMRTRIASGDLHPMEAKMDLARQIVADFHSREEAERAAGEFTRVVRRHETPADIKTTPLPAGACTAAGLRVDKLLALTGLAASVSEATRKIKEGAVEINGARVAALALPDSASELIVHVGKKWLRVVAPQ